MTVVYLGYEMLRLSLIKNTLLACLIWTITLCAKSISAQESLAQKAFSQEATGQKCVLKMGFGLWKPYQYYDSDGNLVGPHIELIKLIASKLDCEISLVQMKFSDILKNIESGDLHWAALTTPTKQRRSYADFSDQYATEYFALYVAPEKLDRFAEKSMSQLLNEGFKLGITEKHYYGESFAEILNNNKLNRSISAVPDSYQNYQRLLSGEIDGFFDNPLIAAFTIRDKNFGVSLARHPNVFYGNPIAFMLSKRSFPKHLVEPLNRTIAELRKDPDFTSKWYLRL